MQNTRFHVVIKPRTGRSLGIRNEYEETSSKTRSKRKKRIKEEVKIKTFKQFIL